MIDTSNTGVEHFLRAYALMAHTARFRPLFA